MELWSIDYVDIGCGSTADPLPSTYHTYTHTMTIIELSCFASYIRIRPEKNERKSRMFVDKSCTLLVTVVMMMVVVVVVVVHYLTEFSFVLHYIRCWNMYSWWIIECFNAKNKKKVSFVSNHFADVKELWSKWNDRSWSSKQQFPKCILTHHPNNQFILYA